MSGAGVLVVVRPGSAPGAAAGGRATAMPSWSQASRPCTVRVSSTISYAPTARCAWWSTTARTVIVPSPSPPRAAAPSPPQDSPRTRGSGPVPGAGPRPPRPGAGTCLRCRGAAGGRSGRPPAPSWPRSQPPRSSCAARAACPARLACAAVAARGAREAREERSACLSLPAGGLSTGRLRWTGRSGSLSRVRRAGLHRQDRPDRLAADAGVDDLEAVGEVLDHRETAAAFGVGVHQADPGRPGLSSWTSTVTSPPCPSCNRRRQPVRPCRTALATSSEAMSVASSTWSAVGAAVRGRGRVRNAEVNLRALPAETAVRGSVYSTRAVSRTARCCARMTTSLPPRTTGTRRPDPAGRDPRTWCAAGPALG